ncbi:MAG TPA: CHAT domain-containing protein [Pseudonocardiaceae bacterium]|jgi:tetratricopeptide (TPR) repeat protein|nr:CHAT domain-containing protein [Pseudonocardiaceae bacterium]
MSPEETLLSRHRSVLADVEAGRVAGARRVLSGLIGRAERGGLAPLVPRFRLTLAWVELDRGRLAACRVQLAAALDSPCEEDRVRGGCLAALSRCAAGEHAAAVAELSTAIAGLRRLGERRWLANALVGRGTAHGYLHRVVDADIDFATAGALYAGLGERVRAAACVHNRGFVAAQAGDLPSALRYFNDAETAGLPVDRHPEVLIDRAQVLVAAGLAASARPVVAKAVSLLGAAGRGTKLAEATLAVAQCAWRAGQPDVAAEVAARAAVLFRRQGRESWWPAAKAVELTAAGVVSPGLVRRVAAGADRHGWWLAAAELRLAAGVDLADVAVRRHRGPALLRALGWLARARLATNRLGVLAACRAGLRAVRRNTATIAAWELRAGVAGHVATLADLGLRAALAGGRARTVLRWADECRAVAGPPVSPPADPVLAERLVALRAAIASGGSPNLVRRLEQRVRAREWLGSGVADDESRWTFGELVPRLGAAALVCFGSVGGDRFAVSVVDGRCRLHRLGRASVIDAAVRAVRFAAAVGRPGALARSAVEVDDALFGPLRGVIEGRPLVVVPAGAGHAVPWGVVPSCVGRPVSVVPSVATWLRARSVTRPTSGERVWVAGPRLRYGCREVRALHEAHGGQLLTGRRATVSATLAALDGAELVHVAAHGRFRADQPLFSAVELADGPLFAYDVQRLRRAPRLVVLSACDAGRSVVRPGGDVLGLATALLRSGTSTVIASVLPVPDRQAVGLVTALHAGLVAGSGPAEALARAQVRHGQLGFVCFGAG